jgi:hypothetical protein
LLEQNNTHITNWWTSLYFQIMVCCVPTSWCLVDGYYIFEEPTVCMCTENSMSCSLTFYSEDEIRMFLCNISACLQNYMVSYLQSYSPPWGSNLSTPILYIYLLLIFPKQNAILIWFPVLHYYKNSASMNKYILNLLKPSGFFMYHQV